MKIRVANPNTKGRLGPESLEMIMPLIGVLVPLLLMIALVASVVWSIRTKAYASISRRGAAVSVTPGILMSVSFYALAAHMHSALGGWPSSIGDAGFPSLLIKHAHITLGYFRVMLLAMIIVWPIALAICALTPRLRRFIPHLSLFAGSLVLNFGLMLLGPSKFLYWWWD